MPPRRGPLPARARICGRLKRLKIPTRAKPLPAFSRSERLGGCPFLKGPEPARKGCGFCSLRAAPSGQENPGPKHGQGMPCRKNAGKSRIPSPPRFAPACSPKGRNRHDRRRQGPARSIAFHFTPRMAPAPACPALATGATAPCAPHSPDQAHKNPGRQDRMLPSPARPSRNSRNPDIPEQKRPRAATSASGDGGPFRLSFLNGPVARPCTARRSGPAAFSSRRLWKLRRPGRPLRRFLPPAAGPPRRPRPPPRPPRARGALLPCASPRE